MFCFGLVSLLDSFQLFFFFVSGCPLSAPFRSKDYKFRECEGVDSRFIISTNTKKLLWRIIMRIVGLQ